MSFLSSYNIYIAIDRLERKLMGITGLDQGLTDIVLAATLVVLSVILAKVVKFLVAEIAPKFVIKTQTTLDDELIKAINGPLQVFIIVLGVYLSLHVIKAMPPSLYVEINALLFVVLIFIGAYLLSNLIHGLLNWYKNDIAVKTKSDLDDMLIPLLSKATSIIIFIMAIIMVLDQLNVVEVSVLIATLGIGGIAVALGAKELLTNLFGALTILMDRPYKIGDRIEVAGKVGDVVEIGLRSTRINTLNNEIIVIPNSEISKAKIINYSLPDSILRFKLNIGIAYDANVEKATAILMDIADNTEGVLNEPRPSVYVTELGDFSVNLSLYVWAKDYKLTWEVPDRIFRQTLKRFNKEGIEIPYPVTTLMVSGLNQEKPGVTVEVFKPGAMPH